jgi:hypothetical protein
MSKTLSIVFLLVAVAAYNACSKDNPDTRDQFVATFSVTETWPENNKTITKPTFSMSVEKSSQESGKVLLNNFANYGAGITVEATISGNSITIPQQTLSNLIVVNGAGSLSGSTLTFTYTESINSVSINISVTATKR